MAPVVRLSTSTATVLQRVQQEYTAASADAGASAKKRRMLSVSYAYLTEKERSELMARLRSVATQFEARAVDERKRRRPYGVVTGMWPVAEPNPEP